MGAEASASLMRHKFTPSKDSPNGDKDFVLALTFFPLADKGPFCPGATCWRRISRKTWLCIPHAGEFPGSCAHVTPTAAAIHPATENDIRLVISSPERSHVPQGEVRYEHWAGSLD